MSTQERQERPSPIDIELRSHELIGIVFALGALNCEITANMSDREIEAARSALTFEALEKARALIKLF